MKVNYKLKLQASSLVEVLIAMVILLLVFGIGLMIFTNLIHSSKSKQSKLVAHEMTVLAQHAQDEGSEEQVQIGDLYYTIDKETIVPYSDRIRIKVTAHDSGTGKIIDSLVMIKEQQYAD